eukprot:2117042-Pleurochrysis_carterae.AAC.1
MRARVRVRARARVRVYMSERARAGGRLCACVLEGANACVRVRACTRARLWAGLPRENVLQLNVELVLLLDQHVLLDHLDTTERWRSNRSNRKVSAISKYPLAPPGTFPGLTVHFTR